MYELNQIRQMAERIKAGLPCRVLVFGSYAWGRPNACSDVDLAVVVPDDLEIKHPARIASKLSQHGLIPIDVIALRESTLAQAVAGSLSYEIRTRGLEL
jgi:predicted nucleotidyltransferase